ncbi:hypothetical protein A2410_00280 [Candidatus Shapirobacteria bacterium RIFOXYC1_FULL_38_24]|nr:MAG: hypothetical protein A2410_00280 [Candidatus Shapirobacteria bacterium RIFOXYC1_FULL_38_24]
MEFWKFGKKKIQITEGGVILEKIRKLAFGPGSELSGTFFPKKETWEAVQVLKKMGKWRGGSENDWIKVSLDEAFESTHPYKDSAVMERSITIPNAKMIRIRFVKFESEAQYDYLNVSGKDGLVVTKLSGAKVGAVVSEEVMGDTLKLKFVADSSISFWGFKADEVEVIYNIPE